MQSAAIPIDPALWEQPMTGIPSTTTSNISSTLSSGSDGTGRAEDNDAESIHSLSSQLTIPLTSATTLTVVERSGS
jgi:hypothetical protein